MQPGTAVTRAELARRMLGTPTPRLWCPPITHYMAGGGVDVVFTRLPFCVLCSAYSTHFSILDGDNAKARPPLRIKPK